MGQRHQAYLIARVKAHGATEPTYRCIGAWHHQWAYGPLPVRATRRFVELVRVKDNAQVVREELRAISGRFGAHTSMEPLIDDTPCPFTLQLMAMAFNVDLERYNYVSGYTLEKSALHAWMYPRQGDNNDGFTVFDVTDPLHPAYCHGYPYSKNVLSGRTYAGNSDIEDDLADFIKNVDMIQLSALQEAWPAEFGKPPLREEEDRERDTSGPSPALDVPSLAELAFRPAVAQVVESGDPGPIEHMIPILEKATLMVDSVRALNIDSSTVEPGAVTLLSKIVAAYPNSIDLSDIPLSSDQVVQVLAGMKSAPTIDELNISHNLNITSDTLRSLLKSVPKIRRIVLFGTSISDSDLDDLLCLERPLFTRIEQIIHPALLSFRPDDRDTFHPAFSCYFPGMRGFVTGLNAISYSHISISSIFQALTDFVNHWVSTFTKMEYLFPTELGHCQIASLAIFSTGRRRPDQPWSQRPVVCCPTPDKSQIYRKGWLFVFQAPRYEPGWYAFLRPVKDDADEEMKKLGHEIHDLKSFVAELKKEGYPEPDAELVDGIEKGFQRIDELVREKEYIPGNGFPLATKNNLPVEPYAYFGL